MPIPRTMLALAIFVPAVACAPAPGPTKEATGKATVSYYDNTGRDDVLGGGV